MKTIRLSAKTMGIAAKQLGYDESPSFFDAKHFDDLPHNELRFGCRKAQETSGLQGVYLLRDKEGRNNVPVVFLCQTDSEDQARIIHKRVWNLNLVPFVVVETPTRLRVYPGFSYDADPKKNLAFADAAITDVAEIIDALAEFHANAIDDGRVFEKWGHKITPQSRVDEHLLKQLKLLDETLRSMGLPRDPSHCLIGKYVWLSYLRDRRILSDWRLSKAQVRLSEVFGRDAKLTAFEQLEDYLQDWLNGEIFPLRGEDRRAVKSEHLQKVAGVFAGDDANGQMAFFPDLYDFSHLPIETLSVVYEQFLHHKEDGQIASEGEKSGAYYTPVCLADFMIEEMDRKLPLDDGVAVFDPACGSGVFLVQAYRRLVERTMEKEQRDLKLTELRSLLKDNIFGTDRDPDACRVARMSLAIALLDYASPPDVSGPTSNFKLPTLSEQNILQKDFFDLDPEWPRAKDRNPPHWIIGNPPWMELKSSQREADKSNKPAWDWFEANKAEYPTSGNQVAEAFAWRVLDFARSESVVGLVLPAITLFKHEAKSFRQGFFSKLDVWCVANFGNLAYVLFAGRTNLPAACLFYRPKQSDDGHGSIATFAPFVTEQDSNRPSKAGGQVDTWNILVRATDWREIDRDEAAKGERLTWKLAMWGSERDQRLLRRIARFPRFEAWSKQGGIIAAQGPEIREQNSQGTYPHNSELIGKRKVSFTGLRGTRRLFTLPASCLLPPLKASECYVRRAGGLEVGEPPHLLFDEARRFAIFHNEYAIIPPRQIGIHGKNTKLLKALSLYLCSLPARWHQFFVSSHWGVSLSIATLADLRTLPIPLSPFEDNTIAELAELYDALAKDEQNAFSEQDRLLAKAENVIAKLLGLRSHERDLIEGFFAGPYECVHGKFPSQALDVASVSDIRRYCKVLRRELDDYLEERGVHHDILALIDSKQVCLAIEGKRTKEPLDPKIEELNGKKPDFFQRISTELRQKHSQRVYFEKTLFFYQRGQMLFLKPRRALEWNARRALLDADDLIGELLAGT